MTWTVTKRGVQTNASLGVTQSVTLTVSGITAGHGIAVFVQYSDFQTDAVTVTDSASQTYTIVDNILAGSTGQILASYYNLSVGTAPTTITASFGSGATNVVQMVAALEFSSSIAGTPTLDGHSGLNNAASSSANSGAGNSSNGDLVLTGLIAGVNAIGSGTLAITGVTTTTIQNNADAAAGYADGSGTTTTAGAASVTSTWSGLNNAAAKACVELIFKEPSSGVVFIPPRRLVRAYPLIVKIIH